MIACIYGRAGAPFVEPTVRDVCAAAHAAGGAIVPLTIEAALAEPARAAEIHRLYVLPFDPPPAAEETPALLFRRLFPRAEVVNPFAVQDLCWDKLATQHRLLERGIPVPETLVSTTPADVHEFVRRHEFAILKERFACGGQGHLVLWFDGDELMGDGGSHRYRVALGEGGTRRLDGDRLAYPAPFYVQRLIADRSGHALAPGQVLRAYVVDNHIAFWSERYRKQYARPADWIVNVSRGAHYRFVLNASEEIKKIALRSADVLGARIGVVDIIQTGGTGPYVLEVDTDGRHMMIDRQFKAIPEYRDFFDFDRYIAEALLLEPPPVPARRAFA